MNAKDRHEMYLTASMSLTRSQISMEPDPWEQSAWAWFKRLPAGSKGWAGKYFLRQYLQFAGAQVEDYALPGVDLLIDGGLYAIRTSTPWENDGCFRFQQLRLNEEWTHALLLGITPARDPYLWRVSKEIVRTYAKPQHISGVGTDGTFWLRVDPDVTGYLQGGSLTALVQTLERERR